ncbi:DNA polymerase III, subunit gamma and tau [Candidatus Wolfebacteria bacterium]|nr:MAG: DNA polymerase III, subunit gamma and tau [Candidatus Wolfebacteria bacterium]
MSEVLYRKYRPKNFKEVIEQDHVVTVLKEAVAGENIAHAYLFSGSRGTGKTSIARILAKEIGTSNNDVYEIDAASSRGIDDIRALRDGVNTLPFESKYKVYIIDEVHMLTKEAFNALLKTLEEPPAHVVFMLATTEVDKLPDTVVSRCQTHTLKKPSRDTLQDVVSKTAKKEGATLEKGVAELIATLGDGSFRDTLGTLQKVLTHGGSNVTLEETEKITGAPKHERVNSLISALAERDTAKALEAIVNARDDNVDMRVFTKFILDDVRAIILLRYAADLQKQFKDEYTAENYEFVDRLARDGKAISSQTVLELLNAADQIGRSEIPSLPLELAVIKLIGETE